MKYYEFNYYKKFRCIKENCKNNCCVGWDINVDKRAIKKYENINDKFNILCGIEQNKFKKDNKNRCVFLDKDNLCKIIKGVGEKYLCQVCRDHPRFRNYFTGERELGLGLSCEEACRIILTSNSKMKRVLVREIKPQKKNNAFERELLKFRKQALFIAQDRSVSIYERLNLLTEKSKFRLDKDLSVWKNFYLNLSMLNDGWKERLESIKDDTDLFPVPDRTVEQLLCYFIFRHLSNAFDKTDMYVKTYFSVLSVKMILAILYGQNSGKFELNTLIDISREYSCEIEYSLDNLNAVYNKIEENIYLI